MRMLLLLVDSPIDQLAEAVKKDADEVGGERTGEDGGQPQDGVYILREIAARCKNQHNKPCDDAADAADPEIAFSQCFDLFSDVLKHNILLFEK